MEKINDYTVFIENPAVFVCTCHGHVISIEKFDSFPDLEPEYFISMFSQAGSRVSWKDRLKHIWYILRNGEPYTDQIIIAEWQAVNMAETILTMAGKHRKEER